MPFDMEMKRTDGVAIQVEMVVSALFQGYFKLIHLVTERHFGAPPFGGEAEEARGRVTRSA